MIKIAILSDLHIQENDPDLDVVLENVIEEFERKRIEDRIDLILVAGDITQSGTKEEFAKAKIFLSRLTSILNLPLERLILVPGNHDYDKSRSGLGFSEISEMTEEKYKKYLGDKDFQFHIKSAFKNYCNFHKELFVTKCNLEGEKFDFIIDGVDVNILAVNSALFSTTGNEKIKDYVNMSIFKDSNIKKNDKNITIVLMHHPLNSLYIKNQREVDEYLKNNFDIIVFGHEHVPQYNKIERLEGFQYINISNGCIYLQRQQNIDDFDFRFTVLEYDTYRTELSINLWVTSPKIRHCGRDTKLFPDAREDGRFSFYLASKQSISKDFTSDPLDSPIPKELNDYFAINYNKLLQVKNHDDLLKLRRSMRLSTQYRIDEIARCFLKHMIKTNGIENFSALTNLLSQCYVFSEIKTFHKPIKEYYNRSFFEEQASDSITKVSRKYQKAPFQELQKKLEEKDLKIQELEKQQISVLETYKGKSQDLMPPLPIKEKEEVIERLDWYKTINLFSNPFPSRNGFRNIDESLYEKIIHVTDTITDFRNMIINDEIEDLLNKTIILCGPFGSGKTTLFQYVELLLKIHKKDIFCINISLDARDSLEQIKRRFFVKLNRKLRKISLQELGFSCPDRDIENDCILMLEKLSATKEAVFIFLDDIYKHSVRGDFIDNVMGFIQSIQTYKTDFTDSGLNTTIIFSAIDEIITRINNDRPTSGSIDETIKMSSISVKDATEMINKRLAVFTQGRRKPYQVSEEYINRLKKIASQGSLSITTFRDFIILLTDRFKRLEFTEDEITIYNDEKSIKSILQDLNTNYPQLNKSFTKLKVYSNSDQNLFEKFILILEDIWKKKPINEGEGSYFEKKAFLARLVDADLLKRLEYPKHVSWTVSENCRDYFNSISNRFRLNPSSILPACYYWDEEVRIIESKTITDFDNILKRAEIYGSKFILHVSEAISIYKELEKFSVSISIISKEGIQKDKLLLMRDSLYKFISALVILCDGNDVDNETEALALYEDSWYEDEQITSLASQLYDEQSYGQLDQDYRVNILSDYLKMVRELPLLLSNFIELENLLSLRNLNLWNEDKIVLNMIRQNVCSENYEIARREILNLISRKLSEIIVDYSKTIFSNEYWIKCLPRKIRVLFNRIIKRIPLSCVIDVKSTIASFIFKDILTILEYLSVIKLKSSVTYFNELNEMSKEFYNDFLNDKFFGNTLIDLLIHISDFYVKLLKSEIETPWNSNELVVLKDIIKTTKFPQKNLSDGKVVLPLIFDSELKPLNNPPHLIDFHELIYTATINIDKIEISIDYNLSQIIVNRIEI